MGCKRSPTQHPIQERKLISAIKPEKKEGTRHYRDANTNDCKPSSCPILPPKPIAAVPVKLKSEGVGTIKVQSAPQNRGYSHARVAAKNTSVVGTSDTSPAPKCRCLRSQQNTGPSTPQPCRSRIAELRERKSTAFPHRKLRRQTNLARRACSSQSQLVRSEKARRSTPKL